MRNTTIVTLVAAGVALVGFAAPARAGTIPITNGDFETPDLSNFQAFDIVSHGWSAGPGYTYDGTQNGSTFRNSQNPATGGQWLSYTNRGPAVFQNVTAIAPDTVYTMGIEITMHTSFPDQYQYGLWADGDGDGTPETPLVVGDQDDPGFPPSSTGWNVHAVQLTFDSADPLPSGAAIGDDVYVYAQTPSGGQGTNNFGINDVTLEFQSQAPAPPIPEPCTLALLGLGGLAVVARRRRA